MAARSTPKPRKHRQASSGSPLRARMIATAHCLTHYGTGCAAGQPRRISVGFIAVDARSGEVVGSTPRTEVRTSARRLVEENKDAIQAAFLEAREAS